jgi:hypothetical protein
MTKATAPRRVGREAIRRMAEEAGCNPLLLDDPKRPVDWIYEFAASLEGKVREDASQAVDEALAEGVAIAMGLKDDAVATIFVFGSNLAGKHMQGSALTAKKFHGAIEGQGEGFQGRSYAIAVRDHDMKPLPLWRIARSVNALRELAQSRPDLQFRVAAIGCEDETFTAQDIAPLFSNMPEQFDLPYVFLTVYAGLSNPMHQTREVRAQNAAVETIEGLLERFADNQDKSEALMMAMMTCFQAVRQIEGDEFMSQWLMAALKDTTKFKLHEAMSERA